MDNFKKAMEEISDDFFAKTGLRMNVETSANNLSVAFACEAQRQESAMPQIPVISKIEITDREVFNGKLDAFSSDFFFFLKEQEESFDQSPYPSSFDGEEEVIAEMLRNALLEESEGSILLEWINTSELGDKIRLRKYLTEGVTGRVAVIQDGVPVVEPTEEYVIVLVRTEQLLSIDNAYPI